MIDAICQFYFASHDACYKFLNYVCICVHSPSIRLAAKGMMFSTCMCVCACVFVTSTSRHFDCVSDCLIDWLIRLVICLCIYFLLSISDT